MPTSLNSLSFDLMHVIASSLDVHDFVHLSRVSRHFQILLQNESMARRMLQVCYFLVPSSSAIFDAESKRILCSVVARFLFQAAIFNGSVNVGVHIVMYPLDCSVESRLRHEFCKAP
ncbi:hypothetical protein GJ744_006886 [Endocarpon pusillum]|uniref:F-box domain-containing protein n=1 Tax=Endocarpon pusillum TaxID=364733 RepID=A0A8H7DWP6_9EURO|nr:hypothetical protein GJ744_006886 [Endocarpon pusillum]